MKKLSSVSVLGGRRLGRCSAALALVMAGLSLSAVAGAVGTRHFVLENGKDFEAGELEGAAVDSVGRVRAGLDLGQVEVLGADSVWAALKEKDVLWLATGNEGKLLKVQANQVSEVAKVEALALTSITRAFGKLIVGAMPGGQLYELKGDKLEAFAKLDGGEHVWALSFDEKQKALYVATGPQGKLFRVTADGTAQVYFDAEEAHLMSVLATDGKVYAGSSEDARLYELTGPGRAKVLYDFQKTEVRGIVAGKNGELYVSVNQLKGGAPSGSVDKTKPGSPNARDSKGGSGQLFMFKDGLAELLFESKDEHLVSLSLDAEGLPIVGTGEKGRVIRVFPDHRSEVIADVEARQLSAVLLDEKGGVVVGSDPIMVHPVQGTYGEKAVWTSEVLDAGIRARFGRATWSSQGKVTIETRSGNTKKPDAAWTAWSKSLAPGQAVASEPGRYLQVRARFTSQDASLSRLDIPYVTDNLRAVVTEVTAKSAANTSGSTGIDQSGGPLDGSASSKVKLSWKVDNPDQDALRYQVEYRTELQKEWVSALEPGAVHTSTNLDWDTADLPEGSYVVRITASDELSNPPGRVQTHSQVSDTIVVDNTAPRFEKLKISGKTLLGAAQDGVGPIQRLEMRAAGAQNWIPFEPQDGIFDQSMESFSVDLSSLGLVAGTLLTVRAFDTAGNFEVAHVRMP